MRSLYGCMAVLMTLKCCTFGGTYMPLPVAPKPVLICDVVGDKIDLDESAHYGLFSNITDFVSAEFYHRPPPEKRYKIVIVTQRTQYIAYNNEPNTLSMLRDYIEHYDSIAVTQTGFEEKWQIVDYDTLGLPITQGEVNQIASMSPNAKGACLSSAMGFGCLFGCLMGGESKSDTWLSDWDLDWVEDAALGSVIGMSLGALGAVVLIKTIEEGNRSKALLSIKEMRKPQEMR